MTVNLIYDLLKDFNFSLNLNFLSVINLPLLKSKGHGRGNSGASVPEGEKLRWGEPDRATRRASAGSSGGSWRWKKGYQAGDGPKVERSGCADGPAQKKMKEFILNWLGYLGEMGQKELGSTSKIEIPFAILFLQI
jgi:hypothetical protein